MTSVLCFSIAKEDRSLFELRYCNNNILVASCKQGNQAIVGLLGVVMLMGSQSQQELNDQHTE